MPFSDSGLYFEELNVCRKRSESVREPELFEFLIVCILTSSDEALLFYFLTILILPTEFIVLYMIVWLIALADERP